MVSPLKMKQPLLVLTFLFLFAHSHAQQHAIAPILEKSFVSFSDSILLNDDTANELAVLYEMAKNKKIVAIGEVRHGTKEK